MLFDSMTMRELTFRNRIVVSPMCQYSSEDGFANDWHLVHLGSRAVGGAALVFSEATAVDPKGRISARDLGLWKDAHIDKLRQITRFIDSQGALPGIQLAHAGRKASVTTPWEGDKSVSPSAGGWKPVAPSAIPFNEGSEVPDVLSLEDIQGLVRSFSEAACRALAAGFRVVEIHSAHGYLLHEFLSPTSNKRTDAYGSTFDNRIRLLLEVVRAVRKEWPMKYPIFVRISATDWTEPEGWDLEQSVQLAKRLKEEGVDLVDCSSGGLVPNARIPGGPGFQVPFAERIRRDAGIATGAVGFITSQAQAETILRSSQADMVFLAREFLRRPYWPLLASREARGNAPWPAQYARASI
jgi:2,4-dienoyl-CoA reductase-like NADH-dependent reductase (Old Yellow Enzyme family)